MAIRYIGTYNQFALEVNIELGGSYVNGVLTAPSWWTASITQWSRHVQEETARRAQDMIFISLEQAEIDALHYGGYPPGSAEGNAYIAQVEATGWEWAVNKWVRSDSGQVFIPPEPTPEVTPEPEPGYKGTILKKELEFNGARALIPAANIPLGQRGLIHIIGRNDMATSQKLGISWLMRDPDGILVEDYKDWQTFKAGSNDTHEFIGGRFDLNKRGNWTIIVVLFMNPEAPIEVARYSGNLCSVVMELEEPQFSDLTATYAAV